MDLGTMVRELGTGMLITTEIFVLTLVFSLPLGMVLAFGRMARLKVLSFLTKLYISIMRGTPLMLQHRPTIWHRGHSCISWIPT